MKDTNFIPKLIQAIIVLICMAFIIYIGKVDIGANIKEHTKTIATLNVPSSTVYFVVATPEKEVVISGINDITDIANKIAATCEAFDYRGEFKYNMILSSVNIGKISESNLLINNNYVVSGDKVMKLNFNLEKYLEKICKNY